ncbi:MAG: DUF5670 family protein, partial [Desulfomonilaceae bacterium]
DRRKIATRGGIRMIWTLVIIILVLWLLGVVTSYTLAGRIHSRSIGHCCSGGRVINLIKDRRAP